MDKLPQELMTHIYEYDYVLHQFEICCLYLEPEPSITQFLKNIQQENIARKYFDSKRDSDYSFH